MITFLLYLYKSTSQINTHIQSHANIAYLQIKKHTKKELRAPKAKNYRVQEANLVRESETEIASEIGLAQMLSENCYKQTCFSDMKSKDTNKPTEVNTRAVSQSTRQLKTCTTGPRQKT